MGLAVVAPTPGGEGLDATVLCHTSRSGAPVMHDIHISPDWDVDTGHDLEAERIAAAFGAYCSCVDLVDRVVPAVARVLELLLRARPVPVIRTSRGRWVVTEECRCQIRRPSYECAQTAAIHARSVEHVAGQFGLAPDVLTPVLEEVLRAHEPVVNRVPGYPQESIPGVGRARAATARDLWLAGISPQAVAEARHRVNATSPMSAASYELLVFTDYRVDYVKSVVSVTAAPDAVEWALTTETEFDREHPQGRSEWLRAGVPRNEVHDLVRCGRQVGTAFELAAALDRPVAYAASVLATWARVSLAPTVRDLVRLHDLRGGQWYAPSHRALAPFRRAIAAGEITASLTESALVLVACGSPARAMELLRGQAVRGEVASRLAGDASAN